MAHCIIPVTFPWFRGRNWGRRFGMYFSIPGTHGFRSVACFAIATVLGVVTMTMFQPGPAASDATPSAPQNAPAARDAAARPHAADGDREPSARLADALADSDRDHRRESLRQLAESLAERDMRAAIEMGAQIPKENDKAEFLRAVFGKWAAREPAQALALALAYPPGMLRAETLNGALDSWTAREPRAALAWLDANVSGPLKEQSLATIAMRWAATDIRGMEKWLATQPPGAVADQARLSLGKVQLDRDPAAAIRTAQGIADTAQREDALVKFYRHWNKWDANAAAAWLQNSAPPEIRQRVARR